jgi:hypothetical protein
MDRMGANGAIPVAAEEKSQAATYGPEQAYRSKRVRTIETATDPTIPIPFEKNKNILEPNSRRPTERSDQAAAFFGSVTHTERSHATQSDKK